jgi:hypothetical protein
MGAKGASVITKIDKLPVEREETAVSPLVLNLVLAPGDDSAPLRVLSLLTRRRCRVRRAAFAIGDGSDGPVMRVEVDSPPGREATVVRWVSALIPVRRVEREQS